MALAQVVHQLSTDQGFAAQWFADPQKALSERGFLLSKEEIAYLVQGLRRRKDETVQFIHSGPTVNWA